MNISLRQLRLFESIARCRSLTEAAEEQNITQSAASQSMKELERQLGYTLLRKTGRNLNLTESGQQALPTVRQILLQMESLQHPNDDFIGGRLRVSASETIASYLMPALLAEFIEQYPKVIPELSIQNSEGVIRQLEQGEVHVGFIEGPVQSQHVEITPWCQDELVVLANPDSTWAQQPVFGRAELAGLPWIVRESGSGTRAVFDRAFEKKKLVPDIHLTLPRQEAIKQSAKAGLGVCCLSYLAVEEDIQAGYLTALNCELELSRTFSIVDLKGELHSALTKRFIEFSFAWLDD